MINPFLIRVILWSDRKKKKHIIYKATGSKIAVWELGGPASEFEKLVIFRSILST